MKQLNRYSFILLATVVLVSACKKEDFPTDVIGSPAFNSNFSFDGNQYQLSAGREKMVLSAITVIDSDTVVFSSTLNNSKCENCGPALYLNLTSQDLASNWGNATLEDKLASWNYSFTPLSTSDTSISIYAVSTGIPGIWSLNDIPQNNQVESDFMFEIEDNGIYEIKLDSDNPGCGEPANRFIKFDGDLPCYSNLYRGTGNEMNIFTVQTLGGFGQADKTYSWTYGDTTVTTLVPTLDVSPLGQATEMLIEIEEFGGCTDSVRMYLAATPIMCVTNFTIDSMEIHYISNEMQAALVNLTFIDDNDVVYSSSNELTDQPAFTGIHLLEAIPYTEPSDPNRPYIKVKYEIHCMLYNDFGDGKAFDGIVEMAFEDPGL